MTTNSNESKGAMKGTNNTKLDFSFKFDKNNFSKLSELLSAVSPVYSVGNVEFSLLIKRNVNVETSKAFLGVYLVVRGKPKMWCCYVRADLAIVSQSRVINKYENLECLYSSSNTNWGYPEFIEWNVVVNPECGYIANDIVKFKVKISADRPQNVDPNYVAPKEPPTKLSDWMSVFENRLYKQLVCRLSGEFKDIDYSSKKELKEKIDSVDENVDSIRDDVDTIKEDISTVKENINTVRSEIMDNAKSAVEELKNFLLKKNENSADTDTGKEDVTKKEEGKNARDKLKGLQNTEAISEEFVIKMLNDFKTDMMKEFFLHHKYGTSANMNSCATGPPWWYRDQFSTTSYYGPMSESDRYLCDKSALYDQFDCSFPRKKARYEQRSTSSSDPLTQRRINKFLERGDGSDSDSSDSFCHIVGKPPGRAKRQIPTEEEAIHSNMDLNKTWKEGLVLMGMDDEGKLETHRVRCLKELYELQKKFKQYEVLETEIFRKS